MADLTNGHTPLGATVPVIVNGIVLDAVLHRRHRDGTVTLKAAPIIGGIRQPSNLYRAEAVVTYQLITPPSLGDNK